MQAATALRTSPAVSDAPVRPEACQDPTTRLCSRALPHSDKPKCLAYGVKPVFVCRIKLR